MRRMKVGGWKEKCYLPIVKFWAKPLKFRLCLPNGSRFCSELSDLELCCPIFSVTSLKAKCKVWGNLGVTVSQVQRWVHWWRSCSCHYLRAAIISGTNRNGLWCSNWPWFLVDTAGGSWSRRGRTLKQKLEQDGSGIQCFSPLGHQFKSSLFGTYFHTGPREMRGEHRRCCTQTR